MNLIHLHTGYWMIFMPSSISSIILKPIVIAFHRDASRWAAPRGTPDPPPDIRTGRTSPGGTSILLLQGFPVRSADTLVGRSQPVVKIQSFTCKWLFFDYRLTTANKCVCGCNDIILEGPLHLLVSILLCASIEAYSSIEVPFLNVSTGRTEPNQHPRVQNSDSAPSN